MVEFFNASLVAKFSALEHQVDTTRKLQGSCSNWNLSDLITNLNGPEAFDQFLEAVKFALVSPVSTALNERFFSMVKRVELYTSTTCGQEKLRDLVLIAVKSGCATECCLDNLIDSFGGMKVRR